MAARAGGFAPQGRVVGIIVEQTVELRLGGVEVGRHLGGAPPGRRADARAPAARSGRPVRRRGPDPARGCRPRHPGRRPRWRPRPARGDARHQGAGRRPPQPAAPPARWSPRASESAASPARRSARTSVTPAPTATSAAMPAPTAATRATHDELGCEVRRSCRTSHPGWAVTTTPASNHTTGSSSTNGNRRSWPASWASQPGRQTDQPARAMAQRPQGPSPDQHDHGTPRHEARKDRRPVRCRAVRRERGRVAARDRGRARTERRPRRRRRCGSPRARPRSPGGRGRHASATRHSSRRPCPPGAFASVSDDSRLPAGVRARTATMRSAPTPAIGRTTLR